VTKNELVLLQGAQSDLLSIYATQGEQTYLRIDQALGILRLFSEAGPVHYKNKIRRLVVVRTHFGIFYSVTGSRVLVGAIMDLRQSPKVIEGRLSKL
jgi:plasmid stabilization system protein ParE